MELIDNFFWRRWAKRHIPKQAFACAQHNGVSVVVPLISYEAWLRHERKYATRGRPIQRMPLGVVPGLQVYDHIAEYLLFTNRPDYDIHNERIGCGKSGTLTEFPAFRASFITQEASIEIPSPDTIRSHGHRILGNFGEKTFGDVLRYAEEICTNQWRCILS